MSNSDAMEEDDFEGSDLDEQNVDEGELDEQDGDKVVDLDDDEEQDENIEEQGENLDEQEDGENSEEQEEDGNLDELEEEGNLEDLEELDEDLEDQDENSDEKDLEEENLVEKDIGEADLDEKYVEEEEEGHLEDLEELDEQDEDAEDEDENSDEKDMEEENLGAKDIGEASLDEKDLEEENLDEKDNLENDDDEMGEGEDLEEAGSLVSVASEEIQEINVSQDVGNSQSSINSDELETEKIDNSGNECDKSLDSKSKRRDESTNSEKNDLSIKSKIFEGKSLVNDGDQSMKENNDSQDSKSEESRSSLNSESDGKAKSLKAPNLLGGKPAAMWNLVNGSNKEDDESDGDLTPEKKKAKLEETEPKKDKTEEVIIKEKENGKESPDKGDGDKIQSVEPNDNDDDDKKSTESASVADEKIDKTGENENGALVETRRRSLRTAAKRIEIEAKTPPKVEKRKSTDSPKSKDKKQIKVETKEPPKPVEPTTEPMSEEILEEAKFPKFLKDTITLGCYVPIRDKNASNIKLKEGESLLETPSITMPLLLKKPDLINKSVEIAKPPPAKEDPTKKNFYQVKPFFNSSVGEFLIGIGLSRVNEWYEKDMMKLKQRQLKRDVNNLELDTSLQDHTTNYARSKQANEPFNFEMKKCKMCDFRTESELVLQGHLLVPHMTPRREFRCNFCNFITRDHKVILFHMEALHGKKGVLELPGQFFYDCPYCPFETNLKTRATSHINKCMKYFLSARNQLPPGDWENPTITAKPITLSDIKSYEMCVAAATAVARTNAQKNTQQRIITTTKMLQQPQRIIRPAPSSQRITTASNLSLYQQIVSASLKDSGHFGNNVQKNRYQSTMTKTLPGKPEITVAVPGGQLYQVVNNGQVVPLIGHGGSSQFLIPQQTSNSNAPQPVALFPNLAASGQKNSISIIPQSSPNTLKRLPASTSVIPTASPAVLSKMQNLPKLQGPYTTVQTASKSSYGNPMLPNTTFVICEICDGYLKDLEQLRTHMLWIHKVKIHPKMLSSRPPLNCQKCQWRFFTDQGLERHLLGAHGLVTSNMQELANKNQDGGRCTVCGRVYVCKLVSHMNQVHKATLKPAHLSYKCTVCSATFNLYKLFENHVYMFHSGSVKRSADDANNAKKKLAASPSVEMTVVPAKKPIDSSMKVTVTPAPIVRATLPPPMKLPAVEPIPSVTITPTNVVTPPPATENPSDRLKKNSVDAENALKNVINIIKKPQPHFNDITRCKECGKLVRNISVHMKLRHTKRCRIKVCHILKCEKCLGSFDGMVVLHTADFEENSDSEGAAEEVLPAVETV